MGPVNPENKLDARGLLDLPLELLDLILEELSVEDVIRLGMVSLTSFFVVSPSRSLKLGCSRFVILFREPSELQVFGTAVGVTLRFHDSFHPVVPCVPSGRSSVRVKCNFR